MNWYATKSGSYDQRLVIDEADGRTVAVAYNAKDAPLLAAAPALLAALRLFIEAAEEAGKDEQHKANAYGFMLACLPKARAAIENL